MNILYTVLLIVQVVCAIGVIVLVLLQHGKGADMGAAFGSGSSGSLFGATGSANFLSRTTGILATVFFLTTLGQAYVGGARPESSQGGVMEGVTQVPVPAQPVPSTPAPGSIAPAVPAVPNPEPAK